MPYQVSRTDTGQFVLVDPATGTVVIDDELAEGFAKLERALADQPDRPAGPSSFAPVSSTVASPRYTVILLAVVLPFAWLAVLYFALVHVLTDYALDRRGVEQVEAKVEELERDLQALRNEAAGAPRAAKPSPQRRTAAPPVEPEGDTAAKVSDEPPTDEVAGAKLR
jgi:hypothetical protein